jgi:hypothetical protein
VEQLIGAIVFRKMEIRQDNGETYKYELVCP